MREFWRQTVQAVLRTGPVWSREVDYSVPELTEAERMAGGLRTERVTCVLYTPKCHLCGVQLTLWVPRYMLCEPLITACIGEAHHVRLVSDFLQKQESSE